MSSNYKVVTLISFEEALPAIKAGKFARRIAWSDGTGFPCVVFLVFKQNDDVKLDSFFAIQHPKGHPTHPEGHITPWTPTHCDLLGNDWYIVERTN